MKLFISSRRLLSSTISLSSRPPSYATNSLLTKAKTLSQLETVIVNPPHSFEPVNCATAFTKLGKIIADTPNTERASINLDGLLTTLFDRCAGLSFQPRDIKDICYGIAKGRLMKTIPNFVPFDDTLPLDNFSGHDLSMMVWSFARLKDERDALFRSIMKKTIRDGKNWESRDLCTLCWSFAKNCPSDKQEVYLPLFQFMASEFLLGNRIQDLSELEVTSLVNAFANMGVVHDKLFEAITKDLLTRSLNTFKGQGLATLLAGYATLRIRDDALLDKFSHHIQHTRVLRDIYGKGTVQILWSYSVLGKTDGDLFRYLLKRVEKFPQQYNIVDWARLVHCVSMQHTNTEPYFYEFITLALSQHVLPHMESLPSGYMVPLAWSLTHFTHHLYEPLVDTLVDSIVLDELSPKDVSTLMWTFGAKKNMMHPVFMEKVAQELVATGLKEFSTQDLSMLAWAFAECHLLISPVVQSFFSLSLPPDFSMEYSVESAGQLVSVRDQWNAVNPEMPSLLLEQMCLGNWMDAVLEHNRK